MQINHTNGIQAATGLYKNNNSTNRLNQANGENFRANKEISENLSFKLNVDTSEIYSSLRKLANALRKKEGFELQGTSIFKNKMAKNIQNNGPSFCSLESGSGPM